MKRIIFLVLLISINFVKAADFNFAMELFDDGLYEEAILEFNKVIQVNPTSINAEKSYLFIGESYRLRDQYSNAESSYQRLLEAYPESKLRDQVIYLLAQMQSIQKKYDKAEQNYRQLFQVFPTSEYTKDSIPEYLETLFSSGKYNDLISTGHKIIQNYSDDEHVPMVYLWLAKVYFAQKNTIEGTNYLDLIQEKFPETNAYWLSLMLHVETLQNDPLMLGKFLEKKMKNNMPRNIEEKLLWQCSLLFEKAEAHEESYQKLKMLTSKFTYSEKFPDYLLLLAKSMLHTKRISEISKLYSSNKKAIENSEIQDQFQIILAQSYLESKNYKTSQQVLLSLLEESKNDTIRFEANKILAANYEKNNQAKSAIKKYQFLINKFSRFNENGIFQKKIADIYFYTFQQYQIAKQNYLKSATILNDSQILAEVYFQIALAEEKSNNYLDAKEALSQIDLNNVSATMKEKIERKLDYLVSYKIKNYQSAVEKLIFSMLNENKSDMKKELIDILSRDLKDYETALQLISKQENEDNLYEKAKLHLNLFKKYHLIGSESNKNNQKKMIVEAIKALEQRDKEQSDEIAIRFILAKNDSLNMDIRDKIEDFINQYPQNAAVNEFRFIIGNYWKDHDMEKAISYFDDLKLEEPIEENDFINSILSVAEFYYHQDQDSLAMINFNKVKNDINLNRPEEYFHYLVIELENEKEEDSQNLITQLRNLISNVDDFPSYDNAVLYLAQKYRDEGSYMQCIELMHQKKEKDDAFYSLLATDYLAVSDKVKAKEMLLHVQNKSFDTLKLLAKLQFETNDLEMAKYSYQQLVKDNPNDKEIHVMLAHLYFQEESYRFAAEQYENFLKQFDSMEEQYITEMIISLYRIENRPRAEVYQKRFKKQISDEAKMKIELNEAIYQKNIDIKKAEKMFSKIIKDKETKPSIRMKAYFWRGVSRLEQKETEDALQDFNKVTFADDQELVNEANLKLGTIFFSKEEYQKALDHYYKVILADDKGELALNAAKNFAYVCKTIEEWQKAIDAYEIILSRWGDEKMQNQTKFDIAFCYYRDKRYQHAIEMFEQAIPILDDKEIQAEAQYWIAESYAGMEKFEKAITEFLKVSYNYDGFAHWAASAELRAGEIYMKMQKWVKAKRIFQRVLTKYGTYSDWGKQATERLKLMEN